MRVIKKMVLDPQDTHSKIEMPMGAKIIAIRIMAIGKKSTLIGVPDTLVEVPTMWIEADFTAEAENWTFHVLTDDTCEVRDGYEYVATAFVQGGRLPVHFYREKTKDLSVSP